MSTLREHRAEPLPSEAESISPRPFSSRDEPTHHSSLFGTMSVRALDDALSARNLANLNAANVPLKLLYEDFSQPVPKRPRLLTGGDVDKDAVNDAYEGTGVKWRLQGKITATTQGQRKGTTWRKLMMSAKNQPRRYLHFEQVTTNGGIKEWLLVDATPGGQAGMAGTHAKAGDEAVQHEQLAVAHAAPQPPPPQLANVHDEVCQEISLGVPTEFLIGTSSGATRAGPLPSASNISSINRNLDQAQGGGASAQQAHPTSRLEGVTDLVNDTDMVGYTSQQNGGVVPVLGSSFVFPSHGQGISNLGTGDVMEASVAMDSHDVAGASSSALSKRRRVGEDAGETNLDIEAPPKKLLDLSEALRTLFLEVGRRRSPPSQSPSPCAVRAQTSQASS